jgi:hypothetical protein
MVECGEQNRRLRRVDHDFRTRRCTLLSLVVIIILARLLGSAFHYFHQPPVIGEIIAGILLYVTDRARKSCRRLPLDNRGRRRSR